MSNFKKGLNGNVITYPLTQDQIGNLENSFIVSPKVGETNGLRNPINKDNILDLANEVIDVRLQIQKGIYPQEFLNKYYPFEGKAPTELTQPLIDSGLIKDNLNGLANVVHMDTPLDMSLAILRWLKGQGVKLKENDKDQILFVESVPDVIEDLADGVKRYANKAFEVKYFYGVSRPEETLKCGVLVSHYDEGCPNHPSFPAGHGAIAGGGVLAFFKHFELSKEQIKIILDTVYLWAMFRSFAGVHYGYDNVAGIWLSLKKYFTKEQREFYSKN